jgi:hypothetical protein
MGKLLQVKVKIILAITLLILPLYSYAETTSEEKPTEEAWTFPFNKEIGIITGFASGHLEEKRDYRIIPGILRLGYNLNSIGFGFTDLIKPILNKFHIKAKGFTEIILEPFLNTVITPNTNIEAGCTILMKYAYPLTEKLYPYGIAGGGVIYFTQHTREQGAQYGFNPQVGTGITYFFQKDLALSVEYRYRHMSNGGLKQPNTGVNIGMVLISLSKYY